MIDDTRAARVWIMLVLSAVILSNISCGGSSNNNPGPSPCDPALALAGGDGQTGEVSTQLADTLKVQATECDPANPQGPQIPEAGVPIAWVAAAGSGTVNGAATDTVVTDASGFARAIWVLGSAAGTQTVTAERPSGTPSVVNFSATATATAGCLPGAAVHPQGFYTTDQTWAAGPHVVTGNFSMGGTANLTIEAGAHVCFDGGGIEITNDSHLYVRGTSSNPVTFEQGNGGGGQILLGVNIGALITASTISNARLDGASITAGGWYTPIEIDSTLVRGADVVFGAPGSSIRFSTIAGGGRLIISAQQGGIIVEEVTVRDAVTEGIFMNGHDVTLTGCEVTGSSSTGILCAGDATTISVHGCNLFNNGSFGLSNGDLGLLDATGNWWGDPAGPNGPNGDGVSGNVNTGGALSAPAILGYRPPE